MALEVGIVGLPNAGKSTLFHALTRAGRDLGGQASSTKPNVGMAPIADERLERVAAVVSARKVTPAAVRVVDVPRLDAARLDYKPAEDSTTHPVPDWSAPADRLRRARTSADA